MLRYLCHDARAHFQRMEKDTDTRSIPESEKTIISMSPPDIRHAPIEIEIQCTNPHLSDRELKNDADIKAEDDADPEAKQHEV